MGFLDWFHRDKKITEYTPDELKREEARLQIRETQTISRIEKLEVEREALFRQGFDVKSPVRRRILARKFEMKEAEARRVERELGRLMKEAMAVSAIRYRLERRADGDSSILKKVGSGEIEKLAALCEDADIDEDMYGEKLAEILGAVAEPEGDPVEGLGPEARSVLDIWERMDDGSIESVGDGLKEARERARSEREAQSETE